MKESNTLNESSDSIQVRINKIRDKKQANRINPNKREISDFSLSGGSVIKRKTFKSIRKK